MTTTDIIITIMAGSVDADLQRISDALRERMRQQRTTARFTVAASIKVGDTVRIVDCRPKYLVGMRAEVTGITGTQVSLRLPHPVGRFGQTLKAPANLLQLVED